MKKTELEELGLTEQDVLNKLVDRLVDRFSGGDDEVTTSFGNKLDAAVRGQIDKRIDAALSKHVLPKIKTMIDDVCLQETNQWGEKRGKKLTFIEYLTQRADSYIREPVNYNGKPQGEDSYNWKQSGTRISYMIHEHLQYAISRAMTDALGNVNSSVRKGLEEAVKVALANIKVKVDTKIET